MITGSMVALVTPMNNTGEIDWPKLDQLIAMHIEQGTDAIVAVGTTGESATLNYEEHCKVIAYVVEQVAGRIPVIAGTGANSTSEAIELTEAALRLKADAALLVAPYYNKPTQQGMYLHYKAIAEAVAIPQILYNVPGRTVSDLLNETVVRLADIPNIIGIKDATGELDRGKALIDLCQGKLQVYSGDDETAAELMLMGATGNISVTANVAPKMVSEMTAAAIAGDKAKALEINEQLMPLHKSLFLEANPIPVKWALHHMGLIDLGIRLPLTPLSEAYQLPLSTALQSLKLV